MTVLSYIIKIFKGQKEVAVTNAVAVLLLKQDLVCLKTRNEFGSNTGKS